MHATEKERDAVYRGVSISDKFGRNKRDKDPQEVLGHVEDDDVPSGEDEDPVIGELKKQDKDGKIPLFWMEQHPKAFN